jgi:chromosome segregation ATPase
MAVDERRISRLYDLLVRVLGEEAAATMFELLPPRGADLATSEDVARLADRTDHRFEQVDQRFEQVDQRFEQVDRRLERIEEALRDIRGELNSLHGELRSAVMGQTRALLLGVLTAIVGVAVLSLSFAQLM